MPKLWTSIHAISVVFPELVSRVKIPIAPEAKAHSHLTVFVREHAIFGATLILKQIARGEFATY
jgi:hypothetical protein